jgi:Inhibitor of Apoptosis domain/Zinc finger, C3HC4 type (RING finger)
MLNRQQQRGRVENQDNFNNSVESEQHRREEVDNQMESELLQQEQNNQMESEQENSNNQMESGSEQQQQQQEQDNSNGQMESDSEQRQREQNSNSQTESEQHGQEQENANNQMESESEQQQQEQDNSNGQMESDQQRRDEPEENSNNPIESEQHGQEQENSESNEVSDQVNTAHIEPWYSQFTSFSTRLATFATWPRGLAQKPESLATAGFFYTGRSDITLCFHCGYGVGQWEPDDDPWIEHARWHGGVCTFVKLSKGMDFVIQHLDPCSGVKVSAAPRASIHDVKCDCSKDNNKNECKSLTCRVCMSESVGVMFYPCGHIVCCVDCSFAVKSTCPVCRKHIRAGVQVHIG